MPAAPVSPHRCTWGAGGVRKWSWTHGDAWRWEPHSLSPVSQGCGMHRDAAGNLNHFTVGISTGQKEVWGEILPFMYRNCARQAGFDKKL